MLPPVYSLQSVIRIPHVASQPDARCCSLDLEFAQLSARSLSCALACTVSCLWKRPSSFTVLALLIVARDGRNHLMLDAAKDCLGRRHVGLAQPIHFLKLLTRCVHCRQFDGADGEIVLAVHVAHSQKLGHFQVVERQHPMPNEPPRVLIEVNSAVAANCQNDAFLADGDFLPMRRENVSGFIRELAQWMMRTSSAHASAGDFP